MASATNAGQFGLDIKNFIEKAKAAPNDVVRKITTDMLTNIVLRTPVGNPDLWAINRTAVAYNAAVADWNSSLRDDPANTDKRGRLKPGRKLNDGMDVIAPEGYVGGRLRANWFVSIGVQNRATTTAVDKAGDATINRGAATINSSDATQGVYITNSLPYAVPIEYGHSHLQAPAGMVRVTVAEVQTFVQKAVAELPK